MIMSPSMGICITGGRWKKHIGTKEDTETGIDEVTVDIGTEDEIVGI